MSLTVLGSGTSTGVPLIGCKCSVCRSKDPKNKRLRASVWFEAHGKSFLVDTSTDLREQALRAKITHVDAVLYTHPHADHVSGIDEMRAFNFLQKRPIPIYGNSWTIDELEARFPYIFRPTHVEGGGIPRLIPHVFDPHTPTLPVEGVRVTPVPVPHGSKECVGYRIEDFAYITDCNEVPATARARLEGLEVLVLDCVRLAPHATHLHLDAALDLIETLRPERAFLTHMGHELDYKKVTRMLPRGVALAYDGLKIGTRRAKLSR